ncbi:MAG TPA: TonB-dependent receptor [Pedobacter sp.]|jgi:hypothetical protein
MKRAFILMASLILLNSFWAKAQKSVSVSLHLEQAGIDDLAKSLENQTSYRLFYKASEFDSLKFSINVDNKPLVTVLDQLLSSSGFSYSFFENSIFLIKGEAISTELASQFEPVDAGTKKQPLATQTETTDISTQGSTKRTVATLQNKLYVIGMPETNSTRTSATITGYIKSQKTGNPVPGAAIFINSPGIGAVADMAGFYTLTLPKGRHELHIKAIGIQDNKRIVSLQSNGRLDIVVQEQVNTLKEVVVTAGRRNNITATQMGVERLDIKTIKQVPAVFGEPDVLRVILTLPGVKSVGESSTGFNVRGGAVDQNLILFNDLTIYNPSHFFGFFSAFNAEMIKDVELYKSSIPAKYGGRLSSVLEVNAREGDKKKIKGSAGIGLITSRINIEGPILSEKTTFIAGARTTYSNWIFDMLPKKTDFKNTKANFSDFNLNLNHQHNARNNFSLTSYYSNDNSNLATDTSYAYNNQNLSLKWKHNFSSKLVGTATTGIDNYKYQSYSSFNAVNAYRLKFNIKQTNLKADFNYSPNSKHTIDFGIQSIYYNLQPGGLNPYNSESLVEPDIVAAEQALESAVYISEKFELSPAISLNAGIRFSRFNNLGPGTVTIYAPNSPIEENNVIGTKTYSKGKNVKTYQGPEYRLSARYAVTSDFAIKASYNTLRQYIHLLSNTTSISPTDVWKLSDMNIKPQNGDQVSLGIYKNFNSNAIETSVETYYKRLNNYLDYKSGASVILNHNIERDVITTEGKAYGVEFLIKKLTGKLNGWVSYTYSRTLLKVNDEFNSETINGGNYYSANFDKPHDFTLISNYKSSQRLSFSFSSTYSTGRPITLPIARYNYGNSQRVLYSERNKYRIPDYQRFDLSINIDGNHKIHQRTHNSWTFGVYNLTARKNPFSTYFVSENGMIQGYKLSIFATAIPFVNYNIRF